MNALLTGNGQESGDEETTRKSKAASAAASDTGSSSKTAAVAVVPATLGRSYTTVLPDPSVASGRRSSSYQYRTRAGAARDDTESPAEAVAPSREEPSGGASSPWSQYLKNKYANRTAVLKSKSSGALSTRAASPDSSDEEPAGTAYESRYRRGTSHELEKDLSHSFLHQQPRSLYMQKKKLLFKIGSRGADVGQFTWPRAVTIGLNNDIVVADSSNHRVQVFDSTENSSFSSDLMDRMRASLTALPVLLSIAWVSL